MLDRGLGKNRTKVKPIERLHTIKSFFFFNFIWVPPIAVRSSDGKQSAYNAGDLGLIPGSGRSPGEGNGNPVQYSCLKNPMDRGAWQATFHGVTRVGHD